MALAAEVDTVPDTIEASLSYFVDTGATPVTLVADYGGSDTRAGGGASETHRVAVKNGRPLADRFALEQIGRAHV